MNPFSDPFARIRDNVASVQARIADAAHRSGRSSSAVRLVAVTKYVDAAMAGLLVKAGLTDLGESRPQELWSKAAALADLAPHWHLVGHLQSNKVRRTLPLKPLIHSADSLKILEATSREAQGLGLTSELLLEVNVSGDAAKHGFAPAEVAPLLPRIAALGHIKVTGLMTMASREGDEGRARREFAALRELRDRLAAACPPEVSLGELSMGMSGDYQVAIEEGATMVRLGSVLFEGLTGQPTP
ncbi:MAG: YggS family pyridoxal phosphate-dependent enzyme [Planctomycetaceae bacterium]|nr:YggS family pyridoxal phosphate-dependent enzyme [Planctomycetaceae bacterium]